MKTIARFEAARRERNALRPAPVIDQVMAVVRCRTFALTEELCAVAANSAGAKQASNFGFTTTSREGTQLYHLLFLPAVEIKDDEGDAEERLKNSLQNGETQFGKAGSLIFWQARHHFLQNNLRILRDAQLAERISD